MERGHVAGKMNVHSAPARGLHRAFARSFESTSAFGSQSHPDWPSQRHHPFSQASLHFQDPPIHVDDTVWVEGDGVETGLHL